MNPKTCGESIQIGETFICKLECVPCRLHFGKECAKEKMNKFINDMVNMARGGENE